MVKVTFVRHDGTTSDVEAVAGESLMLAAVKNGVTGIVAECGGSCTCATCHVYVRSAYADQVGGPNSFEDDMLDLAVTERQPTSRLSCQIRMTDELGGLTVDIPEVQP